VIDGLQRKNQAPESLPRPDLYGARFTSDRAAIVVSYRDNGPDCQYYVGRGGIGWRAGATTLG
jgi:hypothetical protein